MQVGTLFAVLVLHAAYCECAKTKQNIFSVEYSNSLTLKEFNRRIKPEFAPDVEEVARLLASAENKDYSAVWGATYGELLDLAEIDPDHLLDKCQHYKFKRYEELCKKVSTENAYVTNYCKFCLDEQFARCKEAGREKLFDNVLYTMMGEKELVQFMEDSSRFIAERPEQPEEESVKDFFLTKLDDAEQRPVRFACELLESYVLGDLGYFFKGDGKEPESIREASPKEYDYRKRCATVRKLMDL